jgi:hypothetical protein
MRGRWAIARYLAGLGGLCALTSACGTVIGTSVENRPIVARSVGDGPVDVLFIGGLHTGPEDNTRWLAEQLATYFEQHPDLVPQTVTLHFITSANPDGTARGVHTNARGVDLNRNWPADDWRAEACHPTTGCMQQLGGPQPLSEPETWALYQYIEALQPEVTAVWHSEAALVEANEVPGAQAYARAFGNAAGYPYLEEWSAYEITGQLIDALEQRLGLRAFDIELARCCELTQDDLARNWRGLLALLSEVDRQARPTPTPVGPRPKPTPRIIVPGEIRLDAANR